MATGVCSFILFVPKGEKRVMGRSVVDIYIYIYIICLTSNLHNTHPN